MVFVARLLTGRTIKTLRQSAPRIAFDKADNIIVIGIGNRDGKESDFTRDVANDIIKGIGCNNSKLVRKHSLRLRKIERIEFIGSGTVKKLTLSNHCYEVSVVLYISKSSGYEAS